MHATVTGGLRRVKRSGSRSLQMAQAGGCLPALVFDQYAGWAVLFHATQKFGVAACSGGVDAHVTLTHDVAHIGLSGD